MKNLKEKLINESGNLENKAWDAVFDYVDKEAKDVSEFLRFIMDVINEATGADFCRGDKTNNAGYLQEIRHVSEYSFELCFCRRRGYG